MDIKSENQLLITQATIEANSKSSDEKTKKPAEDLTEMITSMLDQLKSFKY